MCYSSSPAKRSTAHPASPAVAACVIASVRSKVVSLESFSL